MTELTKYNEFITFLSSSLGISADMFLDENAEGFPESSLCCCFSGHRDISSVDIYPKLKKTILSLIEKGYKYFICGMAKGFDLLCAECVLDIKRERCPHISLICAVPCPTQAVSFLKGEKTRYSEILAKSEKIVMVSKKYFGGCMHKRNRFMVDKSTVCVCYLTKNSGGTFYTTEYAKLCGLKIINLAEKDASD